MRIENKRKVYSYVNRIIIIINDNCLYQYFINFINMMAFSRRVRVSRIMQKRKVLRLLPTILVGSSRQQKGVFLLVVDFWLMKPEFWPGATKGEFNLARRKKCIYCKSIRNRLVFNTNLSF